MSNEVGFLEKRKAVDVLIKKSSAMVVKTQTDYDTAQIRLKDIREFERDLDAEYKQHPTIIAAKALQKEKKSIADSLEAARKLLKNGVMLSYEQEQASIRHEEELRQQEEARVAAERQRNIELAEQKAAFDAAEKLRVAAEARNDAEAAERAAEEAESIKQEAKETKAAEIVVPVVVLEKPKTVSRRKIWCWRVKLKNGVEISKSDFKSSVKVRAADVPGTDPRYFALDPKAISTVVDSQGLNHGIKNIQAWEKEV